MAETERPQAETDDGKDIVAEFRCPGGGICRISSAAFAGKREEELLRIKDNIRRTAGEIEWERSFRKTDTAFGEVRTPSDTA